MSGWHPIHDNHAIDVMAAVVTFSEPIPDRVLARALRAADEVAIPAGLNSRHSTDTMQFIVGPQGISTPAVAPANVQGLRYNAIFKNEDGTPVLGKIAEQLQVDANSIVYRTWRYVSWSWQLDRMRSLMASPFAAVSDVVSVMSTRLEYLDRFWFDGEPQDAPTSELLRVNSPQLAPHIFNERDLWHVHTGAFIRPGPRKRLQQIMVDALDSAAPASPGPIRRWVHITTALEDRFSAGALDDPRENADFPFNGFNEMHSVLKDLLGTIITAPTASRIYLSGKQA